MVIGSVFLNNRTQAVRLPRSVAFPDDVRHVTVRVVGRARILEPVGGTWDEWLDHGPWVGEDFLDDRDQGRAEEREGL
jgi:antitoxin VapB